MKKLQVFLAMTVVLASCNTNPFLKEWNTPYGIPPFEKIKPEHYIPAIEKGIEHQKQEIEDIVNNTAVPTFENTIAPLELSGEILSKVQGVLFNVAETDRSDELDAVMEQAIPLFSSLSSDISFNKKLYERVSAVYHSDQSQLSREQQVVLKNWYDSFERNGIGLSEELQDELRGINTRLAEITQKIGNNILAESNAFKERFGFSVSDYPSRMTTTEDRELRRQ